MQFTSQATTSSSAASIGSTVSANSSANGASRSENATQRLIRENVQYLIEQLEQGHSETLTAYLRAMARFRKYSFGNVLSIARQKPSASHVAGIRTWNELGRFVNKGEKGIAILAPVIGKSRKKQNQSGDAEEGENNKSRLLGFRRVFVWDILSMHGRPLPELEQVTGEPGVYLDRLREFVSAQGISLEYTESIAPALGTASGNTIRLLPGQSKPEEFNTLVHELAHLALKHGERRTTITKTVRETEAEAVAFVVAQGIGLKADQSASYIQLYHGDAKLLTESLSMVQQVSAAILSAVMPEAIASEDIPAGELDSEAAPAGERAFSPDESPTDTVAAESSRHASPLISADGRSVSVRMTFTYGQHKEKIVMSSTVVAAPEYRNLPTAWLQESPTNPRRRFDEHSLNELAESFKTQGVLQPLLVREAAKS